MSAVVIAASLLNFDFVILIPRFLILEDGKACYSFENKKAPQIPVKVVSAAVFYDMQRAFFDQAEYVMLMKIPAPIHFYSLSFYNKIVINVKYLQNYNQDF